MADRGTVVWVPDPFRTDGGNPRPWLVVSGERMPYPDGESIAVAFATLKDEIHVVGRQGSVTDEFTERVTAATVGRLGGC